FVWPKLHRFFYSDFPCFCTSTAVAHFFQGPRCFFWRLSRIYFLFSGRSFWRRVSIGASSVYWLVLPLHSRSAPHLPCALMRTSGRTISRCSADRTSIPNSFPRHP